MTRKLFNLMGTKKIKLLFSLIFIFLVSMSSSLADFSNPHVISGIFIFDGDINNQEVILHTEVCVENSDGCRKFNCSSNNLNILIISNGGYSHVMSDYEAGEFVFDYNNDLGCDPYIFSNDYIWASINSSILGLGIIETEPVQISAGGSTYLGEKIIEYFVDEDNLEENGGGGSSGGSNGGFQPSSYEEIIEEYLEENVEFILPINLSSNLVIDSLEIKLDESSNIVDFSFFSDNLDHFVEIGKLSYLFTLRDLSGVEVFFEEGPIDSEDLEQINLKFSKSDLGLISGNYYVDLLILFSDHLISSYSSKVFLDFSNVELLSEVESEDVVMHNPSSSNSSLNNDYVPVILLSLFIFLIFYLFIRKTKEEKV